MHYRGWDYAYKDDYDYAQDVRKRMHFARLPSGRLDVTLDVSPYVEMTQEAFEALVELQFPTRRDVGSIGPLTLEQIAELRRG